MTFYIISVFYDAFIVVASILLGKPLNETGLLLLGLILIAAWSLERRFPWIRIVQIGLIALFHRFSQLNWCEALYLIFAVKYLYETRRFHRTIWLMVCLVGMYEVIRFSYSSHNLYGLLGIIADLAGALVLITVFNYIFRLQEQQRLLQLEYRHLLSYDPLTGLANYGEFHRQLEQMISERQPMIAFLVDCTNLKAMNHEHGFQKGTEVLRDVAQCLKSDFDDALLVSRYGGDKFAIVLEGTNSKSVVARFSEFVEGTLATILETRCTFSYALFPDEQQTKDDVVSILEERLFEAKKAAWTTREAQMFRNEKLKVLGEIAASMAHEIRNPLTTVKGFLQISQSHAYNVKPWFELIMGEIQRMSALTDEFLTFSKPHATWFELNPLQKCVTKVSSLVQSEAISLGHSFVSEQTEAVLLVRMDVEKIVQVLLNLLKNAFEAMVDPGTVSIQLYPDGHEGVIEIQDTGPGIPSESLSKLFHPFYTTKETGTGLGLYICHQIISEHGGSITVDNHPAGGARFRISLPLASLNE